MKKDIKKSIPIEGITASYVDKILTLKKGDKSISRKIDLNPRRIALTLSNKEITISSKKATRRELKQIGTTLAHIKNMIKGLEKDFVYKLEICYAHFPMNVKVVGDKVIIKSFLGETRERKAKILDGTKVEIKGNEIIVSSPDIEKAGQTAANIEKATRLKGRDRRIYQDGIFITEKPGRII